MDTTNKTTTVTREQLIELWSLSDKDLLQKVKSDLAAMGLKSLTQGMLSAISLIIPAERARLKFSAEMYFSANDVEDAIRITRKYLEKFREKLFNIICIRLQYCENKKRFAKLFKDLAAIKATDDSKELESFFIFLHPVIDASVTILSVKIPISLIIFIIKKILDIFCKCEKKEN